MSKGKTFGLSRMAPLDHMARFVQGHPRSADKQEEKVGK